MIKKLLLLLSVSLITANLFAQNGGGGGGNRGGQQRQQAPAPPPVLFREVSGVVRDTADNTIIGAVVTLTSRKDTLRTSANNDGVFVFKNVKLATFTLTISSLGYETSIRKYLQNDALKKLVLEPIELKSANHVMNEVKINGTPSITYKVDTVEYRATDYKVRDNATIDELLKKMEGFEVGSDGTVTHQGQALTKAKLNGKPFGDGDVAKAIQNLPADIVEKIQVVDDYGDAAARTGVKDGDPQKVLNITTKPDRSVGNTGRLVGQYGSEDRYNINGSVLRINANQQIGVLGNLRNTVNGVASSGVAGGATNGGGGGSGVGAGAGGGSQGTTQSGGPSFTYRDQWSKKIQVNGGYGFNFRDNNSINISNGLKKTVYGPNIFNDNSTADALTKTHNLNFEIDYSIDSANYLQVTPTYSYGSSVNNRSSLTDNIDNYTLVVPGLPPPPGFSHPVAKSETGSDNSNQNYGTTVFYQHIFKKPHRNASVQVSVNRAVSDANSTKLIDTKFYKDSTLNSIPRDSLSHSQTLRNSINTTYRASATYVEPFSLTSQLEINAQVRSSIYDNKAITDTIFANGQVQEIIARDNIYNYSFTESRFTLNYRFNGVKYNISLGATAVPTTLDGTKFNNGAGVNVSSTRTDFRVIPVARFSYSWSRTERFSAAYTGSNSEPSFQQIQPYTDSSDPNNIIVGNPNLKPTFTHSISAGYNNYLANSKFNFSVNGNATFTDNQITTNRLTLPRKIISGTDTINRTISQTNYLNLSGSHAYVVRYNVQKQLDDRKYNLALNGNVTYGYAVAMDNGQQYSSTTWRFDERFGPRISPTEDIEINPSVGYDLSRSFNSLPSSPKSTLSSSTQVQTVSLAIDGRFYFLKTFQVNYSATKSYVTGLQGLSTNPLVVNAGFEKEFFKRKNLVVTFNIFDLLHQNNFLQQTINDNGYTNTLSNSQSRYFLLGVRVNLQKWSGSPKRNGRDMKRRGDGSFIYE